MVADSLSSRSVELGLRKRGFLHIIGSDEVGRGSLAGPVVAASCCIMADFKVYEPIEGLDDSKAICEETRNRIYEQIASQPEIYKWSIAARSNSQIDASNIMMATMECFRDSIEALVERESLPVDSTYGIVDGNKTPKLRRPSNISCRPFVKGDAKVYTVALASVIAKVTRDRMMMNAHELYPQYGFDKHKGYGTKEHILAIHKYGACSIHRMSFKHLKGR